MAYRVLHPNGVPIECDTIEDAKAMAEYLGPGGGAGKSRGTGTKPPKGTRPNPPQNPPVSRANSDDLSVRMLQIIANGGEYGVGSATLAQGLGIKEAKGIGPVKLALGRALAALGMHLDDVIERKVGPDGTKWHGKARIAEALQQL